MSQLHTTRKMMVDALAGVSPAQWNFKPGPDRWSVGEVVEHVILSENRIYGLVSGKMANAGSEPDKSAEVVGKDEMVLKAVPERTIRVKTTEALEPKHQFKDKAAALAAFLTARDRTIEYLEKTPVDLRAHFSPHPVLGTLDGYQWLLFVSSHSERHINQMKEVMADAKYPKK